MRRCLYQFYNRILKYWYYNERRVQLSHFRSFSVVGVIAFEVETLMTAMLSGIANTARMVEEILSIKKLDYFDS